MALAGGIFLLACILDCEWVSLPSLNNVFINNEQFLYDFFKFSYLGLGDVYEK